MIERFQYDNRIVKNFLFVTIMWGVVGMLVGLTAAIQLVVPSWNFADWGSFGRLRPLAHQRDHLRLRGQWDVRRGSITACNAS
jgi:cbb3-type cytochrome oxidase subunit 1